MVPVSMTDPAVQSYFVYSGILALKVLVMAPLTGRQRYKKKIFANEEDAKRGGKVKFDDPDVERVRRAHLNDLENIPVFWVLGALYLTTGPAETHAVWLFRAFTAARILHTIAYVNESQPARGIGFGVGSLVSLYMGVKVISSYFNAL